MQSFPIGTRPVFVGVGDYERMIVRNLGPDTAYYDETASVSASSNNGSIPSAGSVTVGAGQYFVSAGTSQLLVEAAPSPEGVWTPVLAGVGSSRGMLSAQTSQLYYHAATNSTYFTYLGAANALMILAWRHNTDVIEGPVKVADYPSTYGIEDTHGVPSMCVDDQSRIHIIYGVHNDFPYYAQADATAGSITGGWTVTQLATGRGTYHTVAWDSLNSRIWVLRRAGTNHVAEGGTPPDAHEFGKLFYSANRGATWTGDTSIVDTRLYGSDTYEDFYHGGMRFKNVNGSARLYFDWIIAHGSAHDGPRSDLFAAYYDIAAGVVKSLDGVSRTATVTTQADLFACRLKASDNVGGTGWIVDRNNKFRAVWLEGVRGSTTGALDAPTGFPGADTTNLTTIAWGPSNAWGWAKMSGITDNLVTNGTGALYPSAGGGNAVYYMTGASVPNGDQAIEFDIRCTSYGANIYTAPVLRSGEGTNQQGYQCLFDGSVLQIWKANAAGTGTLMKTASRTALPTATTYRMRCEAVTLADGSVRVYAEVGDGLLSCHFRDFSSPLLTGRPGVKVRGATASLGVRPNAVRVYSVPLRVQAFVGVHNGTSWSEQSLPAMVNDSFGEGGIMENSDGSFDLVVPSGRAYDYEEWEPAILKPGGGFPTYVNSGADLDHYSSPDGSTWTFQGQAVDRSEVKGQGVQGITTPHGDGSHQSCRAAIQVGYSGYTPNDGAPTFELPFYLLSNREVDALKAARRNLRIPRGSMVQHIYRAGGGQPYPSAITVPSQSGASWATLDMTGSVPDGCTAVRFRIIPAINQTGTARLTLNMRPKGVNREQDVELCCLMTPNTDWVWTAWCPVGPDKQIEWTTAVVNYGVPSPQPTVSTVLFQMIGNEVS